MIADAIFKTLTLSLALWIIGRTIWAWPRIQCTLWGPRITLAVLTVPAAMRGGYVLWRFGVAGFLSSIHFTAWVSRFIDLVSMLAIVTVQAIIIDVKVHYMAGER